MAPASPAVAAATAAAMALPAATAIVGYWWLAAGWRHPDNEDQSCPKELNCCFI